MSSSISLFHCKSKCFLKMNAFFLLSLKWDGVIFLSLKGEKVSERFSLENRLSEFHDYCCRTGGV